MNPAKTRLICPELTRVNLRDIAAQFANKTMPFAKLLCTYQVYRYLFTIWRMQFHPPLTVDASTIFTPVGLLANQLRHQFFISYKSYEIQILDLKSHEIPRNPQCLDLKSHKIPWNPQFLKINPRNSPVFGRLNPTGASAMVRPRLPMTRAMCALGTSTISCGVDDGRLHWLQKTHVYLPSGYVRHSYWKWPFIVDFPIENGDFP